MELEFIKISPTENMTVLVNTPVPVEAQMETAKKLMAYNSLNAEQVGFISEAKDPRARKALRMMAGEFCGNATLSLAAWLAENEGIKTGESKSFLLEISGTRAPVSCFITKKEADFYGTVEMPLPESLEERDFMLSGEKYTLPVAVFQGITHVIVRKDIWGKRSRLYAENAAAEWADLLPEVFGILLWDEKKETLEPLVSVKGASLIWERGCGSGTSAIGAFSALKKGADTAVRCILPGGVMEADVKIEGGSITSLKISGGVRIVATGKAYV